jgi:hypothetical protein
MPDLSQLRADAFGVGPSDSYQLAAPRPAIDAHMLYNGGPLIRLVLKGQDYDWPLADYARAEIGKPGHSVKFTTAPDGEETLEITNLRLASSIAETPAKSPRQRQAVTGLLRPRLCDCPDALLAHPTIGRTCTIPDSKLGCDISTSASYTEASMPTPQSDRPPSWNKYELEAVKSLRQVEELTSLDRDTLTRVYREYLIKLSPKRYGMKFRNVLKIMNGNAA